ncbi:sialidase family protein [Oleiharenicola lentus]|uniref:sialidase family protein n=1 Tax=Oleiharenicola lentus TaxID=2508720 RepID=UPI003F668CF9
MQFTLSQFRPLLRPVSVSLALALMLAAPLSADPATPIFERTDLWEVPVEGYLSYRIPCIVVTKSGAVLAFTSARRAVSDWADIDIMMRRSLDQGKTWEERRIISPPKAAGAKSTVDNPTAIVDQETGAVHFLFQKDYAKLFYMRSDDDGKTWSAPVDITGTMDQFKPEYNWNVMAPGPGHGLQMKNGRLVIPMWLCNGGKIHRPSVATTIYSDDHGKSWQRGEIVQQSLISPSECAAVQLEDGRVALFIRNEEPAYRHAVAYSDDGATNWTTPELHEDLYSPISFGTAIRLSGDGDGKKTRLLYIHPDSKGNNEVIRWFGPRPREKVSVRVSYDEGKTFKLSKILEPRRSGYADIAVGRDGMIYALVERVEIEGNNLNTKYLSVFRFNLEWLTDGKDSLTQN